MFSIFNVSFVYFAYLERYSGAKFTSRARYVIGAAEPSLSSIKGAALLSFGLSCANRLAATGFLRGKIIGDIFKINSSKINDLSSYVRKLVDRETRGRAFHRSGSVCLRG